MPSFEELQAAVGFPEYFEEEAKYAVVSSVTSSGGGGNNSSNNGGNATFQQQQEQQQQYSAPAAVEADEVIEPGSSSSSSSKTTSSSSYSNSNRGGAGNGTVDLSDPIIDRRSQWLRIKIVNLKSGMIDLDTRFPAGFLGPVAAIVPQVAGLDLEELVRGEKNSARKPGDPVFSFETDGEKIEIYFEN